MKITCGSACLEEILFIKLHQNLSNDSKDKHISLFILLSIMALKAKQLVSTLHCGGRET
jgi:hypothetical protein